MSSYPPPPYPSPVPPSGWGSPHPVAHAPYAGPLPTPAPAAGRSTLAVAALVMSAVALLLGVVSVLVALTAGTDEPSSDDGTGWGPFRGQVSASTGSLSGADLADAVQQTIRDDGEDSSAMSCPDTARVAQSVTTVCHGRIDDDDWAVVVFFEDSSGRYTLIPA